MMKCEICGGRMIEKNDVMTCEMFGCTLVSVVTYKMERQREEIATLHDEVDKILIDWQFHLRVCFELYAPDDYINESRADLVAEIVGMILGERR